MKMKALLIVIKFFFAIVVSILFLVFDHYVTFLTLQRDQFHNK